MSEPATLEGYLHERIPLARAMGVQVVRADQDGVVLRAPLAPNVNHRRTFFGGSAAALATLAAWALAHERLVVGDGLPVRLVIQRSRMEYPEPAAGDVEAVCTAPAAAAWERLGAAVARRGKGRIELSVELRSGGGVVGRFSGSFVALRGSDAPA